MKNFFEKHWLLGCILILALGLRLYKINTPLLDWHSWRQADTASVTREYLKQSLDPFRPKYHDLSNIPSGKDNPEGYRMVEFPLYNLISASILLQFPSLSLVVVSRLVSVAFSLATLVCIFYLTKWQLGVKVAYLAALFFAINPYTIYYNRVILPEPALLFFSTYSLVAFKQYLQSKKFRFYLLSLLSLMVALLLKPFAAFLGFVYITLILQDWGIRTAIKRFELYLYPALAIVPFLGWREWISQFPEGIPASDWLFNGDGIRFRPAWVRWLGYERITKMILGFFGVIPVLTAILHQLKQKDFFLPSWWLGISVYFIVIATGNVKHDYYQIILTPLIAISLAYGVVVIDRFLAKKTSAPVSLVVVGALLFGMHAFAHQQIKGFYNVNHPEYQIAGEAADAILPADALVIAPQYGGDTAYLFQINRRGWPIGFDIDNKIAQGATHYVATAFDDEAKELAEKYHIVEQTTDYLILDLTRVKDAQ